MNWHPPRVVSESPALLIAGTNIALGTCTFIAAFGVLGIIILLEFKTRKAKLGDSHAALDCVLPAYRPALVCLIPVMMIELVILSLHMFLSFDPDNIFYFFANYTLEEVITFFFLMPAVTKRALKRSVLRALVWGAYCGCIAWLTSCLSGFRYTDNNTPTAHVYSSDAVGGNATGISDGQEEVFGLEREHFRALLLFIEVPRMIFYCYVIQYLLKRRRDSILIYCLIQLVSAFMNTAYVLTLSLASMNTYPEWIALVPFSFVCMFILAKPWTIHAAFVFDSNYWRGIAKPARTRNFTVFFRMFYFMKKANSDDLMNATTTTSRFDLNKHHEVDLWADEEQVDSILSRPLQKMLETNRKALVDFAFLEIEDVLLGQGAFAKVFRGKYKGQPVAVKIFLKQPEINAQSIRTFAEEAKIALKLSHPNIVRFFGLCVRPPSVLLVFELCEQGNLFTVLRTRRQLEWRDRTTIKGWGLDTIVRRALEAARPLAYLHGGEVNFIHRDIKSLNYLVTREGTVKLTDFGTSRLMPSVSKNSQQTMCDYAPLPFRFSIDDENIESSAIVNIRLPRNTVSYTASASQLPSPPQPLSSRHASSSSSSASAAAAASAASSASVSSASERKDSSNIDDKNSSRVEDSSPSRAVYAPSLHSASFSHNSLEGEKEEEELDQKRRARESRARERNLMTPSNSMLLLSSSVSTNNVSSASYRSHTQPIQDFFREAGHSLASYMRPEKGAEGGASMSVPLLPPGGTRVHQTELPRALANPEDFMTRGVGTKSWMSPEVRKGAEYGKPSDVFSLSMVLWEITTSLEPYDDTSSPRVEAIIKDLRHVIKTVSMHSTDVNISVKWLELQSLIEAGLSYRPGERPTAQEIVDKLERLLF